jgi:glycerol-3-phosphate dehydrogenase
MEPYDLLVIGAGCNGAALAHEAVRRGLRVAVVEAGDPAQGTSSRSTKLLHGGVRYLELAVRRLDPSQLRLVRQALAERRHWIETAPFLARELRIALPTTGPLSQLYYRLGLGLYDLLAGAEGLQPTGGVDHEALRRAFPQLDPAYRSGLLYSDGQFDDARLNLLLLLTARQAGATVARDCRVVGFECGQGSLLAAIGQHPDGHRSRWPARVIVNATGIAADQLRQLADPQAPARLLVSRGTHLVLSEQLCPGGAGLLVPRSSDGRVVFVLPFLGRTLVGTTDVPCPVADATSVSAAERRFLLDDLKAWFPLASGFTVSSAWAGGRPLLQPATDQQDSSRVVREHELEVLPCGLISVLGGKWTTCRLVALQALDRVAGRLGRALPPPVPLPLLGCADQPAHTAAALERQRIALLERLPDHSRREAQVQHLESSYGLLAADVLAQACHPEELLPLSAVLPVCRAEWRYGIRRELARSADDLLARRCRLWTLDQAEAARLRPAAAALLDEERSGSPTSHQQNP